MDVEVDQVCLAVQVAGVVRGGAGCGVASADGPAPFQDQGVDLGEALVPGVGFGEVLSGLGEVTVALEEDGGVSAFCEAVDEGAAVASSAVGGVGDAVAEESPEAVADPHVFSTHQCSRSKASRPDSWRQSRAMSGVPQMGLPLMLRLVLIRTGTPVISAKAVKTSARKGLWSPLTVWTRAVSLVWITAGMRARARSVTPLAIDMNGEGWPRVK